MIHAHHDTMELEKLHWYLPLSGSSNNAHGSMQSTCHVLLSRVFTFLVERAEAGLGQRQALGNGRPWAEADRPCPIALQIKIQFMRLLYNVKKMARTMYFRYFKSLFWNLKISLKNSYCVKFRLFFYGPCTVEGGRREGEVPSYNVAFSILRLSLFVVLRSRTHCRYKVLIPK